MSLLSDYQLTRQMKNCGNHYSKRIFLGVFPRDCLPKSVPNYPCTLIINTDTKNLPGKHWVAIYISSYKEGEYFDSFGHEPPQDIAIWLNRFSLKWKKVNVSLLQNPLSVQCGHFVLFYVNERPQVQSHFHVLKQLHSDSFSNEEFVKQYYHANFVKC